MESNLSAHHPPVPFLLSTLQRYGKKITIPNKIIVFLLGY